MEAVSGIRFSHSTSLMLPGLSNDSLQSRLLHLRLPSAGLHNRFHGGQARPSTTCTLDNTYDGETIEGNDTTQSSNDQGPTEEPKQKKSSSSSSIANTEEELPTQDIIYEDTSSEEVDSNYATEIRTEKEAGVARRKNRMFNWLLPDDQEIEEWNLGSEEDPKMTKINKH
ncbi:hypothetical protein L7F22_051078 [Adiantum nelumboides]|nr:hypothetical protein [Adiantum nelumboides]